jgi:hypothetical protein
VNPPVPQSTEIQTPVSSVRETFEVVAADLSSLNIPAYVLLATDRDGLHTTFYFGPTTEAAVELVRRLIASVRCGTRRLTCSRAAEGWPPEQAEKARAWEEIVGCRRMMRGRRDVRYLLGWQIDAISVPEFDFLGYLMEEAFTEIQERLAQH